MTKHTEETLFPDGFGLHRGNIGIKDGPDDLMILSAGEGASAAGVFTKSRFAGPNVTLPGAPGRRTGSQPYHKLIELVYTPAPVPTDGTTKV